MKKKLLSALLCVSMAATMVVGCGETSVTQNATVETEQDVNLPNSHIPDGVYKVVYIDTVCYHQTERYITLENDSGDRYIFWKMGIERLHPKAADLVVIGDVVEVERGNMEFKRGL